MLTVDTREPVAVCKYLEALCIPIEYECLDTGDYMFYDRDGYPVLITRKGSDLLDSVYSGHLTDELSRCITFLAGKGRLFFLQEGVWAPGGTGMSYFIRSGPDWFRNVKSRGGSDGTFPGVQISMQTAGIQFLWTPDLKSTAKMLASLYTRGKEGWPTRITRGIKRPQLHWGDNEHVYRLMALWPHLREDIAISLLKEYTTIGNIIDVARKDPTKLLELKGVGQKSLDNLLKVLE